MTPIQNPYKSPNLIPEPIQPDAPDHTTSVEDTQPVATIPIPQPRRSIRKRKPPAWISSGDYVVKSHIANVHTAPEWEKKVQYMMDLVSQARYSLKQ